MTALPVRTGALSGLVCFYAVIHLDRAQRRAAYAEFARVLAPGAQALIAFHTSEVDVAPGTAVEFTEWWDQPVELTFRYLDPDEEIALMAAAGLETGGPTGPRALPRGGTREPPQLPHGRTPRLIPR